MGFRGSRAEPAGGRHKNLFRPGPFLNALHSSAINLPISSLIPLVNQSSAGPNIFIFFSCNFPSSLSLIFSSTHFWHYFLKLWEHVLTPDPAQMKKIWAFFWSQSWATPFMRNQFEVFEYSQEGFHYVLLFFLIFQFEYWSHNKACCWRII